MRLGEGKQMRKKTNKRNSQTQAGYDNRIKMDEKHSEVSSGEEEDPGSSLRVCVFFCTNNLTRAV